MRWGLRVILVAVALVAATCGGGGGDSGDGTAAGGGTKSSAEEEEQSGSSTTVEAAGKGSGSGGGRATAKDACAALPRADIQAAVGADPGEGELERAAGATICRYFGEAEVTVEIDPVADLAGARTSIEAYGESCEAIDDIGDQSLFCTGGFKAKGYTGQIVWIDDGRTYYVVYNFGEGTPSKQVTLQLAQRLEP